MSLSCIRRLKLFCLTTIIGLAVIQTSVVAQQQPAPKQVPAGSWKVRVKQNDAYFLTVRAKNAPLSEIAAELSRRLKAPVVVSRVMQKQRITVSFENLPLETALQMIAPLPYVHYELRGGLTPVCRGVFLNAYNEPVPVAKLENKTVSFVMQGDTESTGDSKDDPVRVSYRDNRLSVSAKKQSLTVVLDKIASLIGVNFTMKQDTEDTIDLDFKEVSLEDAMSYFPPSVHLHVRKDIQRISTVPLLLEFAK